MRTDCTRDNQKSILPNASTLGFGQYFAKRGYWVQYEEFGTAGNFGRVLGRVHADGKTYLEIVALLGAIDCPAIRWIDPASVRVCKKSPPRRIFEFMCGDFSDPKAVMAKIDHGFLDDSYLDEKEAESA